MIPWEELQSVEENQEEATEPKEEDPTLLFEEIPSLVQEEEDNKVVPSLGEQVMAFELLLVKGGLLQVEEKEDYML